MGSGSKEGFCCPHHSEHRGCHKQLSIHLLLAFLCTFLPPARVSYSCAKPCCSLASALLHSPNLGQPCHLQTSSPLACPGILELLVGTLGTFSLSPDNVSHDYCQ